MKWFICITAAAVLIAGGVFGWSQYEEARRRSQCAQLARVASLAAVAANSHAEDSVLAYAIAQAQAETSLRDFQSRAVTSKEKKFALALSFEIQNAALCREFMESASIETLRINEPCSATAQKYADGNARDIAAIGIGK